jgi:GNAT superfamily N-acetyltransferase
VIKKSSRPTIQLEIHECTRSLWSLFRQYHYLNTNILTSNKHYVALYNSKPVAFISIGRSQYKYKYWRVSRLVVLPDYQGVGIGTRFLTWAAQYSYEKTRLDFFIVSSNPQLIHLRNSPFFMAPLNLFLSCGVMGRLLLIRRLIVTLIMQL